MIKYRAERDSLQIDKILIRKETNSTIWIKSDKDKYRKISYDIVYCDDWESAKSFLLNNVQEEIYRLKSKLDQITNYKNEVEKLTNENN